MQVRPTPYGDTRIDAPIRLFFDENEAGQTYITLSEQNGIPFIIDHITFRCVDIDQRATVFLERGYLYYGEQVDYPEQGWWAKVYRKPTFPTLFIDQAYADERGAKSIIPKWVKQFGEDVLHHVAVRVDDIEAVIDAFEKRGVSFAGPIVGERNTRLRQIFTAAEVRNGSPFSVLELTERNGYDGFYPDAANRLMDSSVITK